MYGCAPAPELRIPNAAIKNAKVSVARIRVHSWRSVRPFKEIICGDVSEFESYMAKPRGHDIGACRQVLNVPRKHQEDARRL